MTRGSAPRVAGLIRRAAPEFSRRRTVLRETRRAVRTVGREGVAGAMRQMARNLDPRGSNSSFWEDRRYRHWLRGNAPDHTEVERLLLVNRAWPDRPLVSVVVPVYNPDLGGLDAMVRSVRDQCYEKWELCIADDHSPNEAVREALTAWAARDPRIKVVFRAENGNIAAASNSALALATGEFIALLDHDDILRAHALHRVVEALQGAPDVDLIYSDEDKILLRGQRGSPHLKGDFDPDYLLSTNYLCHLSVLRRSLVSSLGGFRRGYDGSQDHDLFLRASEGARGIRHIPDVLYSWKQVPGSAALAVDQKPAAWSAGLAAVQDALDRGDSGADAAFGPMAGLYTVRYPVPASVTVSVVMLIDDDERPPATLQSLAATPGHEVEWLVSARRRDGIAAETRVSALNRAAREAGGEVIVFISNDLVPVDGDSAWLTPLLEQALRPTIGAAGGRIITLDGTCQDGGVHPTRSGRLHVAGTRLPVIQRVAAVTDSCLAIQRERLLAVDGFDPAFSERLHDVDLCLRLARRGLPVVFTPLTELRRVGPGPHPPVADDSDREIFRSRWGGEQSSLDPYLSPLLRRVRPLQFR